MNISIPLIGHVKTIVEPLHSFLFGNPWIYEQTSTACLLTASESSTWKKLIPLLHQQGQARRPGRHGTALITHSITDITQYSISIIAIPHEEINATGPLQGVTLS